MKKILFILLAVLFIGCSDDDKIDGPTVCPSDIEYGISFKFTATQDNPAIEFVAENHHENPYLSIDWGDGIIEDIDASRKWYETEGGVTEYCVQPVKHTYKNDGEYIVRLATKNILALELYSSIKKDIINVSELEVKSCPKLYSLSIGNINVEKLTIADCPSLLGFMIHSCQNLTSLDVSDLPALDLFECPNNKLMDIKLSPSIKHLSCFNNELVDLDVSKLENLHTIYCHGNILEKLDVTHNPKLMTLWLSENPYSSKNENKIETLDLSQNKLLEELICGSESLTSLDLSNNPLLERLALGSKQDVLDLSKQTKLVELECPGVKSLIIDFSKNIELEKLNCGGISELDLSNNERLKYLSCRYSRLTSLLINSSNVIFIDIEGNLLDQNALEDVFSKLPQRSGHINCRGNLGSFDCNISIAENKGWDVAK